MRCDGPNSLRDIIEVRRLFTNESWSKISESIGRNPRYLYLMCYRIDHGQLPSEDLLDRVVRAVEALSPWTPDYILKAIEEGMRFERLQRGKREIDKITQDAINQQRREMVGGAA